MLLSMLAFSPMSVLADTAEDQRAYMHGVNFLKIDGKDLLVFSSNNYTPTLPSGDWVHDVNYSWVDINSASGLLNANDVSKLVNRDQAQEPASAAVNTNGNMLVTCEDAEYHPEELDQTFGIWDKSLTPTTEYGVPLMTGHNAENQGGHSGHTAASGDKFLVTFCDGWIDEGGVDGLGTGDDIFARIVNEDGTMGSLIETKVDANSRDWWPVVAGSDTNWLQVWQKYITPEVGGEVYGAITNPDGTVGTPFLITDNSKYYYYDVNYVPEIDRYVVTGSRADGGFISLIDKTGQIVLTQTGLPDTVREARTAFRQVGDKIIAVYPTLPTGEAVVELTGSTIELKKTITGNHVWTYMGTDGVFSSDTNVLFATGTSAGIQFINVDITAADDNTPGDPVDNTPPNDYAYLDNIALNKPATATEEYDSTTSADKAVDGDSSTRWDSKEGTDCIKPVEFTVDLQDIYRLKKVVINWDSSASEYDIQLSMDNVNWDTAYSTTTGADEASSAISVSGQARYVKFVGKMRNTEDWGFAFTEFQVYGEKPFETSISKWKDNKDAAVTYGFAGGFKASLGLVEPLMEQYGIKGTAYVNPLDVYVDSTHGWNAIPTWAEYTSIAAGGNISLGYFGPSWSSHFVNRDGTWALTKEESASAIAAGKTAIESNTGYPCEVMIGNDCFTGKNAELADIMKSNFLATMNGDFKNPINTWNTTDYYNLGGAVIYPGAGWGPADTAEGMNQCVDDAISSNGLLCIEGRGVYDEADYPDGPTDAFPDWWMPTPLSMYDSNFQYVKDNKDYIWNDSLANIVKYMRERDATTYNVVSSDDTSAVVSFNLPAEMASEIDGTGASRYNQTLTAKSSVPSDWTSATVTQGVDTSSPITPFVENGRKWITYDVIPGAGNIEIDRASTGDYVSTGRVSGSAVDGIVAAANDHKKMVDGDTFTIELSNSTLRNGFTAADLVLTGLPEGLNYSTTVLNPATRNTFKITIGGNAVKTINRNMTLQLVVKGCSVNELEAFDSNPINLTIQCGQFDVGYTDITPWKDNKVAAYTATYDDGIIDSLKKFAPLHQKYGFGATIALAPTFIDDKKHPDDGYYSGNGGKVSMGSWDDFRDLLKTGVFEVSSHMMNHAMSGTAGNYKGRGVPDFLEQEGAAALEKDFRDSKARLESELNVPCETIIYPHYDTNDEINAIAEKVYIAARTSGDEFIGNSPDGNNYYSIYSKTFLDAPNAGAPADTSVAEAKGWLDKAIEKGYWLMTVGHGADYEGWGAPPLSVYDGFYSYVAQNRDKVWADTMANIAKYMKERNNSTITEVVSADGSSYSVNLTDTLDNTIYNEKLTMRLKVPDTWSKVNVTQNGVKVDCTVEDGDLDNFVYYNVLPDAGTIKVEKHTSTTPGVTPAPGTTIPAPSTIPGNVEIAAPVVNGGVATVTVDNAALTKALTASEVALVDIPKVEGATSYVANLPATALASALTGQVIQIATDFGAIAVPSNMLSASEVAGAQNVGLSIAKVEAANLDADIKAKIGDKPVIEINMNIDGKKVSWSNPDAPVTISVPYAPTAAELADSEHIVVWYIDSTGKVVSVPTGKYDPATGMVTFITTHFSKYAVAYEKKTFSDISNYAWAKNAIEVMASKGVISGTSAEAYSPAAAIKRADFMLLLVKALGLSAKVDENFTDVGSTVYYAEAVGIAKKLGITAGEGNNKFNPEAKISRQDMMVLINRAMTVAKKNLTAGTSADLAKFTDKETVSSYALESISTLIKNGIVAGDGKNINPLGNATRAETAVLIYMMYNK